MRTARLVMVVCAFICLWSSVAGAAVRVNEFWHAYSPVPASPPYGYYTYDPVTISGNATWTASAGPYILENNVTVAEGSTLTIETGTVIQVNNFFGIYVNGTVSATNATFTRNQDGYWRGIYLAPTAGSSSILNSTISYAGVYNSGYGLNIQPHGYYPKASIYIDSSNPTINGCQISNSETHGIELYSSHATITSTTFSNMGGGYYPIAYDTLNTFATMSGNSTSGTGYNGVGLPSGSLTATGTWNRPGGSFPYLMNGQLTVDTGVTLTVDPGNTVQSNFDGIYINGTLSAVGTAPLPITFTSRSATPAAGDWRGIYLSPTAGSSVLTYVNINNAGVYNSGYGLNVNVHGGYQKAALYLDGISPPLTNLTIQNSQTNGLELYGSNSTIANATIANCGWSGFRASADSRPAISNSTINSNGAGGYYAVSLDATSVPNPTNVSFSGNTKQGIEIRGGTLAASAIWKKWSSNAPYVVTGDVTVNAGVTLTVEPTATVKLWWTGLYIYGTLTANSTTGRITFTSLTDDSIAGDTNGDAGSQAPASPAAGNWRGIYLAPTAGLSNLTNCDINYSGVYNSGYGLNIQPHGYYPKASIYVDSSNPTINGCQISNSETHGIELYSSHATIISNTFANMGGVYYPITYDTLDTFATMSGNSTSGTGYNGIALPSGSLTAAGTWNRPGSSFPYLMNGQLTVDAGITLSVDPGNTIKSNFDGIYINGTLSAVGTASLPITFTSRSATPAAGDWRGIYLAPTAGSSVLTYVTINNAGTYNSGFGLNVVVHGGNPKAALYLDSISPPLSNVTIQNSQTNGLELYGSNSTIANTTLANCGWSGIWASSGSRPAITNSAINGNGSGGYYAVSLDATSVPNPTNVTFSGNSFQGIQIRGGTLAVSATWKKWNINAPYAVTGYVTIADGVTLTIEPTTTVKLWKTVLFVYGTLIANSTTGRITFTSLTDDSIGGDTNGDAGSQTPATPLPGDWRGIYVAPTAGLSNLTNCNLNYGGFYNSGYGLDIMVHGYYPRVSIYIDSSSPTISGCQINNSETHGIELYSSHATITSTTFSNMGGGYYPISYDTLDTFATMSGNSTSGTGYNGIGLPSGSLTASGRWNLPGSSFPYMMTNQLTVDSGVTLTIDPGVTVQSNFEGIYINGILSAAGTAQLPITFTSRSATPAAGDWRGLYLSPTAGNSVLSYVNINHAGTYNSGYGLNVIVHGGYPKTALYIDSINPPLTNLSILNSATNGLELYSASPAITNSRFENCGGYQIAAKAGSLPTISTSRFIGTSAAWGLTNDTPAQIITARNNYWGAATGPTHSSNPTGTGVKISDGIDYASFRIDEKYILAVTVSGSGVGSVYSSPSGISCSSATCTAPYNYLQSVVLTAAPSWYSTVGWSGCSANGNNCSVTLDSDRNVTATFSGNNNVRLNGPTPALHSRIMDAYDAIGISGSGNIQAQAFSFLESPVFSNPVNVLFEGGRNAAFDPTSGYTTVGTFSILKGSVTISNIVIK